MGVKVTLVELAIIWGYSVSVSRCDTGKRFTWNIVDFANVNIVVATAVVGWAHWGRRHRVTR